MIESAPAKSARVKGNGEKYVGKRELALQKRLCEKCGERKMERPGEFVFIGQKNARNEFVSVGCGGKDAVERSFSVAGVAQLPGAGSVFLAKGTGMFCGEGETRHTRVAQGRVVVFSATDAMLRKKKRKKGHANVDFLFFL